MNEKKWLWLLAFIYLVGLAGLLIPALHNLVVSLTPPVILLSLLLSLWYDRPSKPTAWLLLALTGIAGFFAEVLGVHTSLVFGEYSYGPTLGPGYLEVPFLIGANWMALTWYTLQIRIPRVKSRSLMAAFSALLMTFFDYILEPTAVRLHFWHWKNNTIPLQNYIAWFAIAFAFQCMFQYSKNVPRPGTGRYIYLIQLLFFTALLALL